MGKTGRRFRSAARLSAALFTGAAVLAWSGTAQADAPAGPNGPHDAGVAPAGPNRADTSDGGEIIVTAQKREQRLQDVPVSVSVVTGAAIERANLRSLADVTARLPNVRITPGQSVDSLNIRGTGSGSNPGFEQSVATFVDDVYRPRSRSIRAGLFDIEQIEVLKGPQTTFFGANAIAGALNITTRKPGQTLEANASALYGTDNEYSLEGAVGAPVTDTLSVRVAGRAYGMDDFIDNRSAAKRGHLREYTGRVSLRWEPTTDFRSDLRMDGDRLRDGTAFDAELLNCPPDPAYPTATSVACTNALQQGGGKADGRLDGKSSIVPGFADNDMAEVGWTNALSIDPLTLTALTAYSYNRSAIRQDLIPSPPIGPDLNGSLLNSTNEKYRQFSQELRLQSRAGEPIEFTAGLYYQHSRLSEANLASFKFAPYVPPLGAFVPFGALVAAFSPPGANPLGYGPATPIAGLATLEQRESTASAFGAVTLRPFAHLRINAGLRYSSVTKRASRVDLSGTYTGVQAQLDTFQPAPAATQAVLVNVLGGDLGNFPDPKRRDEKLMPSAGVQYDVGRDLMLYATYANGFKAGGYGGLNILEVFGPETVDAFEIGAKGSSFGRLLTYSAALFRSEYKDLQEATIVYLPSGSVASITKNAASSRSQGVEASMTVRPTRAISFTADLAYLDARYRRFPNGACTVLATLTMPNCAQDLSGKRRPFAPKLSGNVGLSLLVPAADWQVRIDPTLYFTSKYFQQSNSDALFVQKGYAKADLRVSGGPVDGRWELGVIAKNLGNVRTASLRTGVPASPGTVIAFPERDRSVALQFTVKR